MPHRSPFGFGFSDAIDRVPAAALSQKYSAAGASAKPARRTNSVATSYSQRRCKSKDPPWQGLVSSVMGTCVPGMARYFVGASPMARLCRAEGKEKGKGIVARRGLKEAQSETAGR